MLYIETQPFEDTKHVISFIVSHHPRQHNTKLACNLKTITNKNAHNKYTVKSSDCKLSLVKLKPRVRISDCEWHENENYEFSQHIPRTG